VGREAAAVAGALARAHANAESATGAELAYAHGAGGTLVCSNVGFEAWLAVAVGAVFIALFVVRAGATQRWIRENPRFRLFGGSAGWILAERYLWAFRLFFGFYALLFAAVGSMSVYCFFHGPG
jgi:hypothetical protein